MRNEMNTSSKKANEIEVESQDPAYVINGNGLVRKSTLGERSHSSDERLIDP
jgi:hypothetical protein